MKTPKLKKRKFKEPKFSIIVPHYDGVISDEKFLEGMRSILQSTYKNFEVLVYHDGPTSRPIPKSFKSEYDQHNIDYKIKETKTRYNDWGHTLRDLGIREAKGDYIVHFNPDNILFPDALHGLAYALFLAREVDMHDKCNEAQGESNAYDNCYEVIVAPIIMEGVLRSAAGGLARTRDPQHKTLLDGFPVRMNNIDCMQVVASKKAWLSIGGWYNKDETSDGVLAEQLYIKYKCIFSQNIIGVHR